MKKIIQNNADVLSPIDLMCLERDKKTPFKAVTGGTKPERFATGEEAINFFNNHKGRCLLSVVIRGEYKVLAYKFK